MTTWYTADLHLGHANIIAHCSRPWDDVEAMNAGLVERWNAVVAPEDVVWVLGDVALSPSKLGPVKALAGRKLLVAGNHDSCWLGHGHGEVKQANQMAKYYAAGFDTIYPGGVRESHFVSGDTPVVVSHMPYEGDHTETERYREHRPVDGGLPLLHGHVHQEWKVRGRQINVGVDVWNYQPISEETIIELVEEMT